MRLCLIADTFPPLKTSGAVQLRDLTRELVQQGHEVTIMLPSSALCEDWSIDKANGAQVLRLRSPKTKDIGYLRRTLAELWMPFAMLNQLKKSPLAKVRWEGIVWYAPSIFFGPIAKRLKRESGCKGYLIIRDIFPEWAADMGLMGRGLPFRFFQAIARYQYSVADVIGIQTEGNAVYFQDWLKRGVHRRLEVLQNWLGPAGDKPCPIQISQTPLQGRKIFVYAGNMGVAQGMVALFQLVERLGVRSDVGFIFVGRGSEVARLKEWILSHQLTNVLVFDEIDPDEIPALYSQCHVGLIALDARHRTHNIPGKFLTYMQSGLPVLAHVNPGNDLAKLIVNEDVGLVNESGDMETLTQLAIQLIESNILSSQIENRCKSFFERQFAAAAAAKQITNALTTPRVIR